MVRVEDLEASKALKRALGLKERRRNTENEKGRFTARLMGPPEQVRLVCRRRTDLHMDGVRGLPSDSPPFFGHLAYRVDDIYEGVPGG